MVTNKYTIRFILFMCSVQKYLLSLLSTKNIEEIVVNSKLDYIMNNILHYIAENLSSTIDDCQKYLNYVGREISYENVEEQIHNLIKLGLVQQDTYLDKKNKKLKEESNESASREKSNDNTYYSISSAGIFYLFRTNPKVIGIELIAQNNEDGLFVNFLYPYLDFSTLEKIEHRRTILQITKYLDKCCETIQKELTALRDVDEKGGVPHILGIVKGLTNPEYDNGFYGPRTFLQGLKTFSKIEWIDIDNTKIIEIEKDKIFKICDNKNNELILEIHSVRNIAVLLDKDRNKINEFNLERVPILNGETYAIRYFNHINIVNYIDDRFKHKHFYFDYEIDNYIFEFTGSMLEYMRNEYLNMNEKQRMIKRQDCIAIAKDKNFQGIASFYKQMIDSRYDSFIKLKNVQQV